MTEEPATTARNWTPAVGNYVETADGIVGTIESIGNPSYLTASYVVVDADGEQHTTSGVALLEG